MAQRLPESSQNLLNYQRYLLGIQRRERTKKRKGTDFDKRSVRTEAEVVFCRIDKKWIPRDVRLGLEFRSRLVGISHAEIIPVRIIEGIVRRGCTTRRCNEKSHPVQADDVACDIALRLTKESGSATVLHQCVAHEHGLGSIVDDHGFKEAPCNDVALHPDI